MLVYIILYLNLHVYGVVGEELPSLYGCLGLTMPAYNAGVLVQLGVLFCKSEHGNIVPSLFLLFVNMATNPLYFAKLH